MWELETGHFVYVVLGLGFIQSLLIGYFRPYSRQDPVTLEEIATSPYVPTSVLLAYRVCSVIWILFVQAWEIRYGAGIRSLKYYTVWTWLVLGLYFALAAIATLRFQACRSQSVHFDRVTSQSTLYSGDTTSVSVSGVSGAGYGGVLKRSPSEEEVSSRNLDDDLDALPKPRAKKPAASGNPLTPRVSSVSRGGAKDADVPYEQVGDWSDVPTQATAALLHKLCTTALIVDIVFWAVLAPKMQRVEDPVEHARFQRLFFGFVSYNQHAVNLGMVYLDWCLCRVPYSFHNIAIVGAWSTIYALFAMYNHSVTGHWMYPFLDTKLPTAPFAYLALFMAHWVLYLAFSCLATGIRWVARVLFHSEEPVVYEERKERRRFGLHKKRA